MEKRRFRKLLPHLAEELESGCSKVPIENLRDKPRPLAANTSRRWAGYDPDVVDFIRRCETIEQAEEVIGYVEEGGEVTPERAAALRKQLKKKGLRSFGSRKDEGYYHKNG